MTTHQCGFFSLFAAVLLTLTLPVPVLLSAGAQNESYLIRQVLMKNYDPIVRPVADSSHSMNLDVSIGIKSFIQLDMKRQTLVTFGWLTVSWLDQFLAWDSEKYGVRGLTLPADVVWRPELVIFNTVTALDQLQDQKIKVTVEPSGRVWWYPGGLLQTFCSIDISHYPFDTQACSIEVMSWTADISVLNGTFADPAFEDSSTENHPEWELVNMEAVYELRSTNYWMLSYRFTLRRKVMFYVMNVVLPILLLSLMNCLVFLLPVDSGEKMTVSVTVFLSFAVFMSLINDSLPQNSDSLCLFSAYVAVQMFLSVCSIVMAATIVFLHGKDREESSASLSSSSSASSMPGGHEESKDSGTRLSSVLLFNTSQETVSVDGFVSDSPSVPGRNSFHNGRTKEDAARTFSVQANGQGGAGARRDLHHWGSLSPRLALHLLTKVKYLAPRERHLLTRTLDKTCFVITVITNLVSCLTFLLLMVAT